MEKAKRQILSSFDFVRGCGTFLGTLRIDVDKQDYATNWWSIEQRLIEVLNEHSVTDFEIEVAKDILPFLESGNVIKRRSGNCGTLGGFAEFLHSQGNPSPYCQLCVLTSRHVVEGGMPLSLEEDGRKYILEECFAMGEMPHDIAAVVVPEIMRDCAIKMQFKSLEGVTKPSVVVGTDSDALNLAVPGMRRVYLWGAVSKPGKGVIHSIDYIQKDENSAPYRLLFISKDEFSPFEEFCRPGDSGAIILSDKTADAEDADAPVKIVAMLVGQEMGSKIYCAFVLADGLKRMKYLSGSVINKIKIGSTVLNVTI